MESRVMSSKLEVKLFGASISAEGLTAIIAAVVIVILILVFYHFA